MSSNSPSNKTQCPHCLTIYQITPAQLLQSKGNVRCGNCHERFKAQLLSDDEIKSARRKVTPTNDLFARPEPSLTEPDTTKDLVTPTVVERGEFTSQRKADELTLEQRQNKRDGVTRVAAKESDERRAPMFDFQIADSELSLPEKDARESGKPADPLMDKQRVNDDIDFVFEQARGKNSAPPTTEQRIEPPLAEQGDEDLINEIDRIIEDRFGGGAAREQQAARERAQALTPKPAPVKPIDWHQEIATDEDLADVDVDATEPDVFWAEEDDLFIEPAQQRTNHRSLLGGGMRLLSLGIVVVCLLFGLAYQIWFKQFGFVQNNETVQSSLSTLMLPTLERLEGLGAVLPKPSNLSGISLISAQAEPHPSRATTTLMRVSFLNRSSVAQQLPWVELTLTDESGKVVARRALKPEDYLYNNATQTLIGPHELKKITIELLAFPKVATGFELKMLQDLEA